MTINLLEMLQSAVQPALLARARDLFGMSKEEARAGLQVILPTLLAGLLQRASLHGGADHVFEAITDPRVDTGIAERLASLPDDAALASSLSHQGVKILWFLFGEEAWELGRGFAVVAGTSPAGTTTMAALSGLAAFGVLKGWILSARMTVPTFAALLQTQPALLEDALPEEVTAWMGWGPRQAFLVSLRGELERANRDLGSLLKLDAEGNVLLTGPVQDFSSSGRPGQCRKWTVLMLLIALAAFLLWCCLQQG